jgi:hypothetical protein
MNQAKKIGIGHRQARVLCNMSHASRLDLIAEGLPLVLASSQSFWAATCALENNAREATVLESFAEEEAAKALILLDIARCPPAQVSGRIGRIIGKIFYDHLARLIYAKAQSWKPVNVAQLQEYVDSERKAHYVEGFAGEYIMPNWAIYSRESTLYADIEVHENGVPHWSNPTLLSSLRMRMQPPALELIESLSALGLFTREGLQTLSDVWGAVDFKGPEDSQITRSMSKVVATRLDTEGLLTEGATDDHARRFYHHWQMPMYNLDFAMLHVSMEELEAEREAALWSEIGYIGDSY